MNNGQKLVGCKRFGYDPVDFGMLQQFLRLLFQAAGHDDFDVRPDFSEDGDHRFAIHKRHGMIGNDKVDGFRVFTETGKGLETVGGGGHIVAIIFQCGTSHGQDALFVIHHQNSFPITRRWLARAHIVRFRRLGLGNNRQIDLEFSAGLELAVYQNKPVVIFDDGLAG